MWVSVQKTKHFLSLSNHEFDQVHKNIPKVGVRTWLINIKTIVLATLKKICRCDRDLLETAQKNINILINFRFIQKTTISVHIKVWKPILYIVFFFRYVDHYFFWKQLFGQINHSTIISSTVFHNKKQEWMIKK